MATAIISTRHIEDALIAEGLAPKNCCMAALVMAVGDPIKLRYEVVVEHKDMAALARVFASIAELGTEKG